MPSRSLVVRSLCLLAAVGALVFVVRRYLPDCVTLREQMADLGHFAPVGYVITSVAASLLFLPRTPLVIIAGMLFGIPGAAALDLFASLLGATAGFFISRHFARERFEHLLHHGTWRKKAKWIDPLLAETESHGISFVVLIRVVHVFPFCLMNYLCGVLPVRFRDYFLGTLIGLIPGTFALVYCGSVFGCLLIDDEAALPPDLKMKLLLGGALLAILSVVPMLWAHRHKKGG